MLCTCVKRWESQVQTCVPRQAKWGLKTKSLCLRKFPTSSVFRHRKQAYFSGCTSVEMIFWLQMSFLQNHCKLQTSKSFLTADIILAKSWEGKFELVFFFPDPWVQTLEHRSTGILLIFHLPAGQLLKGMTTLFPSDFNILTFAAATAWPGWCNRSQTFLPFAEFIWQCSHRFVSLVDWDGKFVKASRLLLSDKIECKWFKVRRDPEIGSGTSGIC